MDRPGGSGRVSRRRVLRWGLGGLGVLVAGGAAGVELVLHDVLPGHAWLNRLDGACDVPGPAPTVLPGPPVTSTSGQFFSAARNRRVGYTIAHPVSVPPAGLPLVVVLHGYGGDHTAALAQVSLEQALGLRFDGAALPPMALVAADGGGGYWHGHAGDDPMAMIVDELIPMCRALGLGRPPQRIGALGTSMGAYGALLLAEKHPGLVSAVATISPAVWTTYDQARAANAGAFSSARDFADNDVIAAAPTLAGVPVRLVAGREDPFHPGAHALIAALPRGADVHVLRGCHTDAFAAHQQPASLAFLGNHLQ